MPNIALLGVVEDRPAIENLLAADYGGRYDAAPEDISNISELPASY